MAPWDSYQPLPIYPRFRGSKFLWHAEDLCHSSRSFLSFLFILCVLPLWKQLVRRFFHSGSVLGFLYSLHAVGLRLIHELFITHFAQLALS